MVLTPTFCLERRKKLKSLNSYKRLVGNFFLSNWEKVEMSQSTLMTPHAGESRRRTEAALSLTAHRRAEAGSCWGRLGFPLIHSSHKWRKSSEPRRSYREDGVSAAASIHAFINQSARATAWVRFHVSQQQNVWNSPGYHDILWRWRISSLHCNKVGLKVNCTSLCTCPLQLPSSHIKKCPNHLVWIIYFKSSV